MTDKEFIDWTEGFDSRQTVSRAAKDRVWIAIRLDRHVGAVYASIERAEFKRQRAIAAWRASMAEDAQRGYDDEILPSRVFAA